MRIARRRHALAGLAGAGAVALLVLTLLGPRQFTATASFLPADASGGASSLAGLAAQFGVDVSGGQGGGQSPDFYADLLVADQTLGRLVTASYRALDRRNVGHDTTLVAYLVPSGTDLRRRQEIAIAALRRHLKVETGPKTGVVTIRVTFPDPLLASQVAERAVAFVNQFNVQSRQSQARVQREFLAKQSELTRGELSAAEDSLLGFLLRNRDYRSSPTLGFEYDRLERSVTMRQTAYTQVFQAYLQAQANEAQDTPVITVVEAATIPALPNPRHLLLRAILGAVLFGVLGLVWYSVVDGLNAVTQRSIAVREAMNAVRQDLGGTWLGRLALWAIRSASRQPQ